VANWGVQGQQLLRQLLALAGWQQHQQRKGNGGADALLH